MTNGDAGERLMMPWWVLLLLDGLTAFTIAAGGGLLVAMIHSGADGLPSRGAILTAVVLGLLAASNQLRARLALPPVDKAGPGV